MHHIRTLEEVIHGAMSSLCLISSHAQHLLARAGAAVPGADEVQIIYEEAERAAALLSLVPRGVARIPVGSVADPGGRPGQAEDRGAER